MCLIWVHEACVGLTPEDEDVFVCPDLATSSQTVQTMGLTQNPLKEKLYVKQPKGFVHPNKGDKVYKLKKKGLYGLKQTAKAWNDRTNEFLLKNGFNSNQKSYLLLYVDIILCTKTQKEEDKHCGNVERVIRH
ncbi:hypothetical protein CBL_20358 [Carabus blaptoides fortunei]